MSRFLDKINEIIAKDSDVTREDLSQAVLLTRFLDAEEGAFLPDIFEGISLLAQNTDVFSEADFEKLTTGKPVVDVEPLEGIY